MRISTIPGALHFAAGFLARVVLSAVVMVNLQGVDLCVYLI